ncbi:MAG: zf-HC2 domain-containing protein [Vicinamibacterales bacterium]
MMHAVSCEDVQNRLDEFHDDELSVEERVAIQGHLHDCVTCTLVASELQEVRASLREAALGLPDRAAPEADHLSAGVVERVRVEAQLSWTVELRSLFQDMHLVWAALGATAATLVCLIGSLSVFHATSQSVRTRWPASSSSSPARAPTRIPSASVTGCAPHESWTATAFRPSTTTMRCLRCRRSSLAKDACRTWSCCPRPTA